MTNNQTIIEAAFEERSKITPENVSADIKDAINQTIDGLNDGSLRVATRIKDSQNWETHQWIKKAVLLSFRIKENEVMDGSYTKFFDKVDSKFNGFTEKDFKNGGYRVVPNANVRKGKVKSRSQAQLVLGQAHFELENFDEAKKQFRAAARDKDKRIKKTANSWIKYAENEEVRVKNLALRREFIEKSKAEARKKAS